MDPQRHGSSLRVARAARIAGGCLVALLALTGCSKGQAERFGWPPGVTPQAERMLRIWQASVWAALVVGVIVWGLAFYVVVRYRKRTEEIPRQVRYNLPVELLYTVIPVLIVAVLFFYTAIDENFVDKESPNPQVKVGVEAFQWNWKFNYEQVRDKQGNIVSTVGSATEIPVLVVPTHKTIRFVENSDDVVHSFWVPEFLFKRDVIPGRTNSFEITIDKAGAYVGRCAEFCGTYHSQMNFEVRAVSWADYQKFLRAKESGQSTAESLQAIGLPPHAVTTHPFKTKRTQRSAS